MKKITIITAFLFVFSGLVLAVSPAYATNGPSGPAALTGCGFNSAGDYTCVSSGNVRLPANPGAPNIPGYGGPQNNNMQIPPQPPYTPGDLSPGLIIPYIPVIPLFTFPLRLPLPGVPVIPIVLCDTMPTTPTTPGGNPHPTPQPGGPCSNYLDALAQRESSNNWSAVNQFGYLGRYQMGAAALIDAGYAAPGSTNRNIIWTGRDGVNSTQDFLNNHQAQNNAINRYNQVQWGYIQNLGLDRYVGQTINGQVITQSGLLAGAHNLGVGNLQRYLQSNGQTIPRDGNGNPITDYMGRFANCPSPV